MEAMLEKEASKFEWPTCSACGQPEDLLGDPCMKCVKARHRTVLNRGRCTCLKSLKRPDAQVSQCGRTWTPCRRCLGRIEGGGK